MKVSVMPPKSLWHASNLECIFQQVRVHLRVGLFFVASLWAADVMGSPWLRYKPNVGASCVL